MRANAKRREALADFLKTRRARLHPEQFDLPPFPRRRTLGLRREEVAHLVGVGVSWYTWLEQGRDIQVSDHVLERLARILQLNAEERTHLFVLARGPVQRLDLGEQELPLQNAAYQAILDMIDTTYTIGTGQRIELLDQFYAINLRAIEGHRNAMIKS